MDKKGHLESIEWREMRHGAILLATYSRPKELHACLTSVANQESKNRPIVIVIHQRGNEEVAKVIDKFRLNIKYLIEIDSFGKTPLENINFNRILGYEFCFDFLKLDFALAIEEDIVISRDAYEFCEQLVNKYWDHPKFNGVNLGSFEKLDEIDFNTYSRISYGLHGQAAAITEKAWRKIDRKDSFKRSEIDGLDSQVEPIFKRGFFATSNASRYIDFGWNGTHAARNSNDPYYKRLKESWVGDSYHFSGDYKLSQIHHSWRKDALPFGVWSRTRNTLTQVKHWIKVATRNSHEN
jgi:hypothetical protein